MHTNDKDIRSLKKQVKILCLYAIIMSLLLLLLLFTAFSRPGQERIIRAEGIIIIDSLGRERILIGAPVPSSKDRVRTDTNLVRKHWASQMGGDQYMKYYNDYHHGANGIILLNEHGFDKLAIGDRLPDPNIGQRNGVPTGMLWNDEKGFERGGLGAHYVAESDSYVNALGLDSEDGEALHLIVADPGIRALYMGNDEGFMVVGQANRGSFLFQNEKHFSGILVKDKENRTLWEKNALAEE